MSLRLMLCLVLALATVGGPAGAEEPPTASRRSFRVAGILLTTLGGLALTAAGATLPLSFGACAECPRCGCSGGNWGWSAGSGIAAALLIPVGIGLTVFGYHEPGFRDPDYHGSTLSLAPVVTPTGGGLSLRCAF